MWISVHVGTDLLHLESHQTLIDLRVFGLSELPPFLQFIYQNDKLQVFRFYTSEPCLFAVFLLFLKPYLTFMLLLFSFADRGHVTNSPQIFTESVSACLG